MNRTGKGVAAVRADQLPPPESPRKQRDTEPNASAGRKGSGRREGRLPKFSQSEAFAPWGVRLPRLDSAVWRVMWDIQPGDGGVFFASHGEIARRLQLPKGRPNIVRAVQRLIRHGLLVQERKGCSRTRKASEYRIPPMLPSVPTDTRASVRGPLD
jgi:hypothetical protein